MSGFEILERYFGALRTRDWKALGACLAEDVHRTGPYLDVVRGRRTYVEFLSRLIPTLPGYEIEVARMRAVGDGSAVVELCERVEWDGVRTEFPEVVLFEFDARGRIVCVDVYLKQPPGSPAARGRAETPVEAQPIPMAPIGRVRSPVAEPTDEDWGSIESEIVVEPRLRAGLRGLEEFSHVLVVTFLHGASFDPARHLLRRPRGLAEMPEVGIFAQRAKDRPNPLGVTCVALVDVREEGLLVRGLDAIDGTSVLDIKPFFRQFDAPAASSAPAWVDALMRRYF